MGDAAAWRGVWDGVVFLACAWACPIACAIGIWLAFAGVRRVLDRGLGALGRGGGR